MDHKYLQQYRNEAINSIPNTRGVYTMLDWFMAPLYVGATVEGLRARIRRHNTSARSDLIAGGRLCVSEVAFIDIMEIDDPVMITLVESNLIHSHNNHRPLFNNTLPKIVAQVPMPEATRFQLVPNEEIERMRDPLIACAHHSRMLEKIINYAQTTKDNPEVRHCINIRRSFLNYHAENLIDA